MANIPDTIAAGHKMLQDSNLQDFGTTLGCSLEQVTPDLHKTIASAIVTTPAVLMGRQHTISYLRERGAAAPFLSSWNSRFNRAAAIEKDLAPFFGDSGKEKDSLEEDAIGQLSFQGDIFKPLNHVPWLLFVLSIFKIWLVPTMTVLLPIVVWILPYFLLRFVYNLPISQDQYVTILQGLMSGQFAVPNLNAIREEGGSPLTLKSLFQYGLFAFTFIQSMIQPIQNAMHLYKTDTITRGIGHKILELREIVQQFRKDLGNFNGIHVKLSWGIHHVDESDPRRAFMLIQEYPTVIHTILTDLAHLEIMWRISLNPLLNPVKFVRNALALKDCTDISLETTTPVSSSLELVDTMKPHAILTGPNGGGKSSFLRATLQCVLLGHTFGYAPAKEAHMPRFTWIACGIQLRDTPGKLSMFETEVKFAAECLATGRNHGPGLVIFDELFHSTNPPDGVRTATQFLNRLWNQKDVFSIVSTHVFPLVSSAPASVQAICCPAERKENGDINFTYRVQPGICMISSVHTVWEKFGLAERDEVRSETLEQSLPVKEKDKDAK
jgi:hypothetical protein